MSEELEAMRALLAQRRAELALLQLVFRSNAHARLSRACLLQEIPDEAAAALHADLDRTLDRVERERAFELARRPQGALQ